GAPPVAVSGDLHGGAHAVHQLKIGVDVGLDVAAIHGFIGSADDGAIQKMRRTVDRETEIALLGIRDVYPVDGLEVDDILATVADGHAGLFQANTQQIVDVPFRLFLKIRNGRGALIGYAAFVKRPSLVAHVEIDDHALFREFGAIRVGIAPVISEI